jgi:hypothetical protein
MSVKRRERNPGFRTYSSQFNSRGDKDVKIRAGYDIAFQCSQETPMILMLSIEPGG